MLLLDVTIGVASQPNIPKDLHSSFGTAQGAVDAYALTLASSLFPFPSSALAERYGRRLLFIVGLVIFEDLSRSSRVRCR
jgi:MFS family permease